jgi:hypothetical protein
LNYYRRFGVFLETQPKETAALCFGLASLVVFAPSALPVVIQGSVIGILVAAGTKSVLDVVEQVGIRGAENSQRPTGRHPASSQQRRPSP